MNSSTVQLSNPTYDRLKQTATVLLPGVGALYFALAQIWGLPAAEEVVGTIAAVNVFLGLVLNVSSKGYNNSDAKFDGVAHLSNQDGRAYLGLEMNEGPEAVAGKKEVVLKVEDHTV